VFKGDRPQTNPRRQRRHKRLEHTPQAHWHSPHRGRLPHASQRPMAGSAGSSGREHPPQMMETERFTTDVRPPRSARCSTLKPRTRPLGSVVILCFVIRTTHSLLPAQSAQLGSGSIGRARVVKEKLAG
jgi:hypothetical protein